MRPRWDRYANHRLFLFFDCLRNREFPATIAIRSADSLDYPPEPGIFHDVAGHVPMHTDRAFANTLVRFGECAHTAVEIVSGLRNEAERVDRLTSSVKAMARLFLRSPFTLVGTLEKWMRTGKLNNVAPGKPEVNEIDLKIFLHAMDTRR